MLARFTGERITFGQGMTNDLVGWRARYENDCVRFTACTDLDHEETRIGIPGGFSLYNALASLSAVQALGVPLSDAEMCIRDRSYHENGLLSHISIRSDAARLFPK